MAQQVFFYFEIFIIKIAPKQAWVYERKNNLIFRYKNDRFLGVGKQEGIEP